MSSKVLLHIFWKPECITIGKWKNSYVKIYIQTISQLGSQYWKTEIGLYTEPSLTRVYQNLFSSLVSSLFFREIIFARKIILKIDFTKKKLFLWIGAIFDHALNHFTKTIIINKESQSFSFKFLKIWNIYFNWVVVSQEIF